MTKPTFTTTSAHVAEYVALVIDYELTQADPDHLCALAVEYADNAFEAETPGDTEYFTNISSALVRLAAAAYSLDRRT